MTRMLRLVVVVLGLFGSGCAWDSRLHHDVRFALPCDMRDAHVQAWVDAGAVWQDAGFTHAVEFEICDASNRNQIYVGNESTFAHDKILQAATQQLDGVGVEDGAEGATIEIRPSWELRASLRDYRRLAVHEMGHALGLIEHSDDVHDIMYWAPEVDSPSEADTARMRELYR